MPGMRVIAAEDVAESAAAFLGDEIRKLSSSPGRLSLAVSGGETPWAALSQLAESDLPWSDLDVYQVDERVAPAGDRARNLTRLESTLATATAARVHPMAVEADDLTVAAADYAASLPPTIDIVQLGLGTDGHTASLFPWDSEALRSDLDVVVTGPARGHRRMTLTLNAINRAGTILWIVAGEHKRDAVARLLANDQRIPAGLVRTDGAVLIADPAALGR